MLGNFAQNSVSEPRLVDAVTRRRSAGRNSPQGPFLNIGERLAARAKLSPFSLKPEKQALNGYILIAGGKFN